jgi:hypothetical protein
MSLDPALSHDTTLILVYFGETVPLNYKKCVGLFFYLSIFSMGRPTIQRNCGLRKGVEGGGRGGGAQRNGSAFLSDDE